MQRPTPSLDRSSLVVFAAAATVWIGVMAAHPRPEGLLASTIVATRHVAMVRQPYVDPHVVVADLSR